MSKQLHFPLINLRWQIRSWQYHSRSGSELRKRKTNLIRCQRSAQVIGGQQERRSSTVYVASTEWCFILEMDRESRSAPVDLLTGNCDRVIVIPGLPRKRTYDWQTGETGPFIYVHPLIKKNSDSDSSWRTHGWIIIPELEVWLNQSLWIYCHTKPLRGWREPDRYKGLITPRSHPQHLPGLFHHSILSW